MALQQPRASAGGEAGRPMFHSVLKVMRILDGKIDGS
jgi:hypothetical protein